MSGAIAELNDGAEIPPVKGTDTVQDGIDHAHAIVMGNHDMRILGEVRDGTVMRGTAPLCERRDVTRSLSEAEVTTVYRMSWDSGQR